MSQDAPKDKTSSSQPEDDDVVKPADNGGDVPTDSFGRRKHRWERRRQKIRDEIERNRRGEYKVPTWVLVVILIAVLAGWAALIFWA